MKKRMTAFLLALMLILSGCTSMLERDYVSSTRHVEYHVEDDLSVLQAESYQGLVSALLYFVSEYAKTGVVHLSNYTGDVGADLEKACAEVMKEDPLGAYALRNIEHSHTRIVSYYEVNLKFDYTRTREELERMRTVGSVQTLTQMAAKSMAEYEETCAIGINYFSTDEADLLTKVRQRRLDNPLILAEPEVRVKLFPESGSSRVVEFTFVWPEDVESLEARSSAALAAAQRFLEELTPPEEGLDALYLARVLRERVALDEEAGGGSAYDALVDGTANKRGMTLALKLLCQVAKIEATVVEGWFGGTAAHWLILTGEGEYSHLDPNLEVPGYYADDTFRGIGYEWSTERYPACTFEKLPEPAVDEVTEETELTGEEGETAPEEKA